MGPEARDGLTMSKCRKELMGSQIWGYGGDGGLDGFDGFDVVDEWWQRMVASMDGGDGWRRWWRRWMASMVDCGLRHRRH